MENSVSPVRSCCPVPEQAKVSQSGVLWLQGVSLSWMAVELGVSIYGAVRAHSPALAAFGSDSLVELLSGVVVILQWTPRLRIEENRAARLAAILLGVLAAAVTAIAVFSLVFGIEPAESKAGIGVTAAALVVMPVLVWLKRRQARRRGNVAMAVDATQSATCAYLAALALGGLALNAAFGLAWADSAAALLIVPLLLREAREAWHWRSCGCC